MRNNCKIKPLEGVGVFKATTLYPSQANIRNLIFMEEVLPTIK